jgi:hypothetical protein
MQLSQVIKPESETKGTGVMMGMAGCRGGLFTFGTQVEVPESHASPEQQSESCAQGVRSALARGMHCWQLMSKVMGSVKQIGNPGLQHSVLLEHTVPCTAVQPPPVPCHWQPVYPTDEEVAWQASG